MRISDWSSEVCFSDLSKGETADEITKSLDSGELSPAFRSEGRGQTSRAATRGRGSAARAAEDAAQQTEDRQSVVSGKSVSVRVDIGGRRIIKKKTIKPDSTAKTH